MNANTDQLQVSNQAFSNFELFTNVLSGYDIELQQLDHGRFNASLLQVQCGKIFINRFTTVRRLEVSGNPPPGLRTFGIPTAKCSPFTWRNHYSDGNSIQIYKPVTELAMLTHPFFEAIDISMTEQHLNALTRSWEFPELDKIINNREMAFCDPVKIQRLRASLELICTLLDRNPGLLRQSAELQDLIANEVPYLLVQALMSADNRSIKASPEKRNHALKTTIDYIRKTPQETLSFKKFCGETGINERTLQRAFLDHFGIAPKAYAKALQLNKSYKKLLSSHPQGTTISEVASSFGFWHMSQFSRDYHRHFGELPSETLRIR